MPQLVSEVVKELRLLVVVKMFESFDLPGGWRMERKQHVSLAIGSAKP
jgi:hypothetical protein